jgi:two-component system CheB/CheR fusion protein
MNKKNDTRPGQLGHIVGIGASAGGLEALERLFQNMQTDTGLAFVIVQHLSPDFHSVMDELLIRKTNMSVQMVRDGVEIKPDSIYLIPPKKEMIISGGSLLLTDKDPHEGFSLPIDQFFRSLAREYGEKAVGVILSGTGSDGSRGIRDIHDAGGLVIVESEESAKFDGMPRSAIETGMVDLVLPVDQIGEALSRFLENPIHSELVAAINPVDLNERVFKKLFQLILKDYGIDFGVYKQTTVLRRIERRLLISNTIDLESYVDLVADNREELQTLYKDLLIGVTQFFRDPEAFDFLATEVLARRLEDLPKDEEFRIWVAGCATGEEAYSLAITLDELAAPDVKPRIKIFATDVHQTSLDFASEGIYDENSLANVSVERRERYFTPKDNQYQVSPALRQMIVFARQNVIREAPFTKMDLISCRNMLIYFQLLAQRKVLSLFHFGLKPGGTLMLGPSEGLGELEGEFKTLQRHWKIFTKRRNASLRTGFQFLNDANTASLRRPILPTSARPSAREETLKVYEELLNQHLAPSVLIDEHRQVLHVFGDAGRFLQINRGPVTGDVLELFDAEFRTAVAGAIQRVAKQAVATTYTGKPKNVTDFNSQVKVSVSPIFGRADELTHMLVSFAEVEPVRQPIEETTELNLNASSQARIASLEEELNYSNENLQSTIEELEASNEELQATNEELIASNEEMQSTNEELHSVNEELYTVNAEYQRKISELTELTDDMDHLFVSTDVGVLFLDKNLSIRKFTPRIAKLFNFIEQDIGQSFERFTHNIEHKQLLDKVREVLKTQQPYEHDVQDRSGHEYFLRILPYQSRDAVEGVVLTLIDVASLKQAQKEIDKKEHQLHSVMENSPSFIFIKDLQGRYLAANEQAERVFEISTEKILGQTNHDFLPGGIADQIAESDRILTETGEKIEIEEVIPVHGQGRTYLTAKFPLRDQDNKIYAIAGIKTDITRLKMAQLKAKQAVHERDKFMAMLSHELRNPLAAIQNASSVLQRLVGKDKRIGRVSGIIHRHGTHLSRILDDLLDISRFVQNKIELRKSTFDLRTAAEDALLSVRSLATTGKVKVIKSISSQPIPINGDASRIEQVIVNLLVNAIKYTQATGEVNLDVNIVKNQAQVSVIDNGAGMSSDLLKRIFEPFVQGDSTLDLSQGGMGVGLTLVNTIVGLHEGQIVAESEGEGLGSHFRVTLPLSDQKIVESDKQTNAIEPQLASHALKVVLVEDEPDAREMMTLLLEMDGHQIIAVADGLSAVTAIEIEKPTLALVDIGLPELDGYGVMSRLKKAQCDQHTFCVALTGFGQQQDIERSMAVGFHMHITKPISSEDLARVISEAALFRSNAK